jgi:hypothetical protein
MHEMKMVGREYLEIVRLKVRGKILHLSLKGMIFTG